MNGENVSKPVASNANGSTSELKLNDLERSLTSIDWLQKTSVRNISPSLHPLNVGSHRHHINSNTNNNSNNNNNDVDSSPQDSPTTVISPTNSMPSEATTPVTRNFYARKPSVIDNEFKLETGGTGKPPYSYATLITYAIQTSKNKQMTLNEIYNWIMEYYPYYRSAGNGWKVMLEYTFVYFFYLGCGFLFTFN